MNHWARGFNFWLNEGINKSWYPFSTATFLIISFAWLSIAVWMTSILGLSGYFIVGFYNNLSTISLYLNDANLPWMVWYVGIPELPISASNIKLSSLRLAITLEKEVPLFAHTLSRVIHLFMTI